MAQKDGMTFAPTGKSKPVVKEGEFVFAAAYLDHGHIKGQTNGLLEAGGTLKYVYDYEPARIEAFVKDYPQAQPVDDFERILDDPDVHLVAAAAIPSERGPIGLKVMEAGMDYFTDKAPFTTLEQLEAARKKVSESGRKYMVYYSERLHNLSTYQAGELIRQGAIGRVLQVVILAPHRLNKVNRPDWFFDKDKYGGILTDIGSHQVEQFLYYTNETDAVVNFARVENFANPDKPGLEDFGEVSMTAANGASCYCRVDWFTPDGLSNWGDGRAFILGTEGYIEVRKYFDIARSDSTPRIFLADGDSEKEIAVDPEEGFPFFGRLILDVLNRTENAMTQEHAFKAAELSLMAQQLAERNKEA